VRTPRRRERVGTFEELLNSDPKEVTSFKVLPRQKWRRSKYCRNPKLSECVELSAGLI
jgi:hypothetical protein